MSGHLWLLSARAWRCHHTVTNNKEPFFLGAMVTAVPSPVHQRQYVQHGGHVRVGVARGLLQVFQGLGEDGREDRGSIPGPEGWATASLALSFLFRVWWLL